MPSRVKAREWKLRSEAAGWSEQDEVHAQAISNELGLSKVTVRVCFLRGLKTSPAIQEFLSPKLKDLKDPFLIRDMEKAVDRLEAARGSGERIRVFGDYDVDGTCGAALLVSAFKEFGLVADAIQPDRFKDGYGLNELAVEQAHRDGIRLLVTVDCGISSFAAAQRAQELGVELMIVDHHQIDPQKGLPPALAIINPQRADCESGLKELCGCGLGFYLVRALRSRGVLRGWWASGSEPNLKKHLDLVVIATAADMVPLVQDNHILVRQGMEVLKYSKKPGVRALLEVSGLSSKSLTPGSLGFVLGPRINASGRLALAGIALELLTTDDDSRAWVLAQELERLNAERMQLTHQIWDEVKHKVEAAIADGQFEHGIVVASEDWHEGVVGIVASRVVENFRRPAVVIAIRDGHAKGSVRSYGGKDVLAAVRECATDLSGFGGHRHAAGLSLDPINLPDLAQHFNDALGRIDADPESLPLYLEGDCRISELDLKTLQELENLGPFGPGNPEPVFALRARVQGYRLLKERHLKFELRATEAPAQMSQSLPASAPSYLIEAIWFHATDRQEVATDLEQDGFSDRDALWACVPEINKFRGKVTPTLRVRDWRPVN